MGSCGGGLVSCLHDTALFVTMLANGGKMQSGRHLLQHSTVRALWRDWLALSAVVGHGLGRRKPLPGWPYGPKIGWNPLGHVRRKDNCLYMGGWSTSWAIYPQTRLATISMSQTLMYFDIPGWIARRDELDSAVEFGVAQHRRRLAARIRHRFSKARRHQGGKGGTAAGHKGSALSVSRALRAGPRKVRAAARRAAPRQRGAGGEAKAASEQVKSPAKARARRTSGAGTLAAAKRPRTSEGGRRQQR